MIYGLIHPDTLEVRYVGKTRFAGAKRLHAHRNNFRRGSDLPVYRWWGSLGQEPCIVRLAEGGSAEEIVWIADLKSKGARLLNCTAGGDGGYPVGSETAQKVSAKLRRRKLSPEHRAKIGLAATGNRSNTGRTVSPETRAKISANSAHTKPWLGKKLSAEHRAKLGTPGNQHALGLKHSPETRAIIGAKSRAARAARFWSTRKKEA